jgi:hypothetical protein
VLENRVLRRLFGPNRDEVKEGWRKLLNGDLRDLYSSPSIIRIIKSMRVRWVGKNAFSLLVGKHDKRPLGRPRREWIML